MKCFKVIFVFVLICLFFVILNCAGAIQEISSVKKPEHRIFDNTYINSTYNCQISVPSNNWKLNLTFEEFADGFFILELDEDIYSALGTLAISKHPQRTLKEFAQIGTYNAEMAKYTYIAGKPSFFASKKIENKGKFIRQQFRM